MVGTSSGRAGRITGAVCPVGRPGPRPASAGEGLGWRLWPQAAHRCLAWRRDPARGSRAHRPLPGPRPRHQLSAAGLRPGPAGRARHRSGRARGPGGRRHPHRPRPASATSRPRSSPRRWPARCRATWPSSRPRRSCRSRPEGAAYRRPAAGRLPQPLHLVRRRRVRSRRWPAPPSELGHEYLVLTDHSPRLTVAHGLNRERLLEPSSTRSMRSTPSWPRSASSPAWRSTSSRTARSTSTTTCSSARRRRRQRPLQAADGPPADDRADGAGRRPARTSTSSATAPGRLIGKRPPSTFDADYVFAACAQFDTAVEINCRPERLDPPERAARAGRRLRLLVLDRHRRPRHRPARVAAARLRPGRRVRGPDRADRQHVAGRRPAGLAPERAERAEPAPAVGPMRPQSRPRPARRGSRRPSPDRACLRRRRRPSR